LSKPNRRNQGRSKGVLPVRLCGKDRSGNPFQELVHTLDLTLSGARVGAVHHALEPGTVVTIQYRQHKIEFRVVWAKQMKGTREYQIGLEAVVPERDPWGLQAPSEASPPLSRSTLTARILV
jgi:hypothetical protein